ncbi:hypothetical protein KGMB02408_21440 [Bacteroides faecalis]|uniref:Uncharacterized protein n=1 Tax=Bacteroides faecalis TaxID=2447885 RepID=A0A401LUN1_9BACE|nr:hypothetical protein KGMB02408_21440 [Bacteroides faecalis]
MRFEGGNSYDIMQDPHCVTYLWGGFFYRDKDRIVLELEGYGTISADRVKVLEFKVNE